ncbi:MAG: hypothetical protein ACFE96_14680 [Candidatus Hermodarchaeota archaeon]
MRSGRRNHYIGVILVSIILLNFTPSVFANNDNYYHFTPVMTELIWSCRVCDMNKMNALFGENWNSAGLFENLSQGKRMKWYLYVGGARTIIYGSWEVFIDVDIWMWNNGENWGSYDYALELSFFDNVSQYPSNYNFSNVIPFVPFMFPAPTGEYISSIKLSDMYDVDNRVLPTLNVEIDEFFLKPDYRSERITIIALYNGDGILSSLKLYTIGNVVILDIELETIPIYVLPTTLGLLGAFFIAIILYLRKRRIKK